MKTSKQLSINRDEIKKLRAKSSPTLRPTVVALEKILYQPITVLDHGFVRVIDYMGDDSAIVQAARVSYGRGTKKTLEDQGLINYLFRHNHTTPFEMCEIKLHIKMPIFVARQWLRHRTANINEYSARYSVLDQEFYIPNIKNLSPQSLANKQCRNQGDTIGDAEAKKVLQILQKDATTCYQHYLEIMNLDEKTNLATDANAQGIARELARMNLTLNYYTQLYWKIDLHNLLHFLKLRCSDHAQFEIRKYAKIILNIVEKWVPYAYEAFMQYKMDAIILSNRGFQIMKKILKNDKKINQANSGLSQREWSELMQYITD